MAIPNEVIEFFKGDLGKTMLVKGEPGTGKTIFALTLLKELYGSNNGIYLSTRVDNTKLYADFPWISKVIPPKHIIDATQSEFEPVTARDNVDMDYFINTLKYSDRPSFLGNIYRMCDEFEVAVVVIDSWDAVLTQTGELENKEDLETLITDISSKANIDFILVTEYTFQDKLDYLVDSVITMQRGEIGGRALRTLSVDKLRGVRRERPSYLFSLEGGIFNSLEPFNFAYPSEHKRFEPINDTPSYFSSGSEDLDNVLDGGYPLGSFVFLDVGKDVPQDAFMNVLMQTVANFMHQENPVVMFPTGEVSPKAMKANSYLYGFEDKLNELMNFIEFTYLPDEVGFEAEEYIRTIEPGDLMADVTEWQKLWNKLKEDTGNPVLNTVGFDVFDYIYKSKDEILKLMSILARSTADASSLTIALGRDSTENINKYLADISNIHIKLEALSGSIVLYGVKPRTELYYLGIDVSAGYPRLTLEPIV
ncbi:MAG: GvpD protein [Candidatus Syntrophoarchaeum sp. GoM_oil]|nr:MAG: GvpD protein [Candidatus Syntrophoarchaeum sp. GoM_oil]